MSPHRRRTISKIFDAVTAIIAGGLIIYGSYRVDPTVAVFVAAGVVVYTQKIVAMRE